MKKLLILILAALLLFSAAGCDFGTKKMPEGEFQSLHFTYWGGANTDDLWDIRWDGANLSARFTPRFYEGDGRTVDGRLSEDANALLLAKWFLLEPTLKPVDENREPKDGGVSMGFDLSLTDEQGETLTVLCESTNEAFANDFADALKATVLSLDGDLLTPGGEDSTVESVEYVFNHGSMAHADWTLRWTGGTLSGAFTAETDDSFFDAELAEEPLTESREAALEQMFFDLWPTLSPYEAPEAGDGEMALDESTSQFLVSVYAYGREVRTAEYVSDDPEHMNRFIDALKATATALAVAKR